MIFPRLDFDNAPFKSGVLFGLFVGGGLLLSVLAIWVLLVVMESGGGSGGGGGGIFGFIILPIAMFAGAPWSIWALKSGPKLFLLGIAAGDLINGLLLGVLIGSIAKIRQMLRLRNVPNQSR
jgi:hypothetical protein